MQTERVCQYSVVFVNTLKSLSMIVPRSIGFANVTTASLPSETDVYESPDLVFLFPF